MTAIPAGFSTRAISRHAASLPSLPDILCRQRLESTTSKYSAGIAGKFAPDVFALGLIAASFIALIVISLGSSWGVTEAMGWGRQNWFKVYLIESIPAVIIPMITLNLINLALSLMVLQIVVLVGPSIILGFISSNKKLMGKHSLSGSNKVLYWTFLVLIFATGVISIL